MNIKDFAEKWMEADKEAWQKGNFEPLEALEDANLCFHPPMGLPDMVGFVAHKQQIVDARKNCSDIKQEWRYLTGAGNLCVISYTSSFRVKSNTPGSWFPVGKKVSADELLVMRIERGKTVEGWAKGQFTITD